MNNLPIYIITIIIVLFILSEFGAQKKLSELNNSYYGIHTNYEDHGMALSYIAIIDEKIISLLTVLKRKYPNNDVVKNMLKRYNPDKIAEINPDNIFGRTSFTIQKGGIIKYCMRDKKTHKLHKLDDIVFVALHELSHLGDWNYGHELSFWSVFKFILIEAYNAGIHIPKNYSKQPFVYCGLDVNYNPYHDNNLIAYNPL